MKKLQTLIYFLFLFASLRGQGDPTKTDSLIALLKKTKADTSRVKLLSEIGKNLTTANPVRSIGYSSQAVALAKELHWEKGIVSAENLLGTGYSNKGSYDTALVHYLASIDLAKKIGDKESVSIGYTNIGVLYYFKTNFAKALEYYSKAREVSEEIGDAEGVAYSYHDMAIVYNYLGKYFDALSAYDSARKIFDRMGNKTAVASIYNNVGIIQANLGNFKDAIDSYFKALRVNEAQNDIHAMAINYNGIGMVYSDHQDYDDALQYNFKALHLFEQTRDIRNEGVTLSNISSIYSHKDSLQLALRYDSAAIKISDSIGNKHNVAQCYLGMGSVDAKLKDYPSSIKNYSTALTLFQEIGDTSNLSLTNCNMADVYFEKGDYPGARDFALKALDYAMKIKETQRIRNAHKTLSQVYEKLGDLKNALFHYKAFQQAKDSLFNEDNTKKIVQAQMQYDFDKKQLVREAEQKRQLAIAEEKRRSAIKTGSTIVIAVLIFCALFFYFYRLFQKNRFRVQVAEVSQRALIAQLDTHFVTGALMSINEFITNNDKDSASLYLLRFGRLIRDILEASLQKSVAIQEEIDFINNYLDIVLLRYPQGHIAYSISIQADIDSNNTFMPPMVLQVLVENALLHGFDNKRGGTITIDIQKTGNSVHCRVGDNGKGRHEAESKKELNRISHGGKLAKELLHVWQTVFGETTYKIADLTTEGGRPSGTLVEFTFPLIEK